MVKKKIKSKVTLESLNHTVEKLAIGTNRRFDDTHKLIENLAINMAKGFSNTQKGFLGVHELIENLAISTKTGFDKVDEKFVELHKEMDERFDKVDLDILGVKQRLSALDNRLDTFVDHEKRLTKVESTLKIRIKN